MTELAGLRRFWEATLKSDGCLLEPSVRVHIENTIKYLKKLEARDAGKARNRS